MAQSEEEYLVGVTDVTRTYEQVVQVANKSAQGGLLAPCILKSFYQGLGRRVQAHRKSWSC